MFVIITWELWRRRWSIFWWTCAICAFVGVNLAVYSSLQGQAAELNKSLADLPAVFKELFAQDGDFISPVGYLNSKLYSLLLPLLLSILGIGLGSSLLAREEQSHTLELLLARPLSRGRVLLGKALAGLLILAITTGATLITILIAVTAISLPVELANIALATLMTFLLSLLFSSIAFAMTAIGYRARSASIGLASLIALGGYILTSFGHSIGWMHAISRLTPYYYYRPSDILHGTFSGTTAAGFIVAIGVLGVTSWLTFRHRDIE